MNLMKAESPGPSVNKLVPKLHQTAKILYGIYFGLTAVEILLLFLFGMKFFDATVIGFATAGTGGFGIQNDSIAGYSAAIQIIITIFMILFGINFNVYFLLMANKWKQAIRTEEIRWYLSLMAVGTILISINLMDRYSGIAETLRQAAFQVSSIMTSTGFATADFNQWPEFSKMILVILMFVGACAGSTGGGIKVSRIMILVKSAAKELKQYLHPRQVRKISLDGKPVEHEVVRNVNIFMTVYILLFAMSTLALSLDGHDFTTNFTAVAATMNNTGPGLNLVGPAENFAFFSNPAKLVLIIDMLAGRLEIFPLALLFLKDTWKKF